MPRKYGKDNYRKESDRYDQLPKWVVRSGAVRLMTHPDTRLYLACVSLSDKHSRAVIYKTQKQLADLSGIFLSNLKRSIRSLAESGLIAVKDINARVPELQVIFNNPEKAKATTTPLNAEVASKRSFSTEKVIPRITKSYHPDNTMLSPQQLPDGGHNA